MSVRINDTAPDFTAETTEGPISFHEWIGDGYAVLFSHPRAFTPVCTTELGTVARLVPEFEKRNAKVLGVSVDSNDDHLKWKRDIAEVAGVPADFAIVDDTSLKVSKLYDMLPAEHYLPSEGRTPQHSATVRTVFIIAPDKKVRLTMAYPMSVGRNFAEIIRALDAIQATDGAPISTPADWRQGEDVIVATSLNDEQAEAKFGKMEKKLPYLRYVKAPETV
ncbi:peroxiredoxin [Paracoccus sp. Z118]|uniref:peroxiredoxin n=1 Tax=Paracoccus sp. Z118 TaxID=2851017 RepID=UPI001C2C58FB|nr:peroxiredoxin [Paracoccus sp. Z118]MBV0891234.1 peroxiredoxin [Paracoccus sp. Z118]